MPVSAIRFSIFLLVGFCLPHGSTATAQETDFERIDDQARIFTTPDAAASKAAIEKQFTTLNLETGVELFVLTVSTATGTSAREMAASKVDAIVPDGKPGALLVIVRADDSVGIAPSSDTEELPPYVLSPIAKSPGSRSISMEQHEFALRSASELVSAFRKHYGDPDAGADPRKSADFRLLIIIVLSSLLLAFLFGLIYRKQNAPAAPSN